MNKKPQEPTLLFNLQTLFSRHSSKCYFPAYEYNSLSFRHFSNFFCILLLGMFCHSKRSESSMFYPFQLKRKGENIQLRFWDAVAWRSESWIASERLIPRRIVRALVQQRLLVFLREKILHVMKLIGLISINHYSTSSFSSTTKK